MAFVPLFAGLAAGIDLKPSCTDKGRAGDDGRLWQAAGRVVRGLFRVAWTVRSEYERLPIEHEDEGLRRYLGVIQSRLDDWAVFADLAGWCLPLDMTTISRIDPMPDFAVDRADHLERVPERMPEQDRTRIEQRP
jgi:hypothetical protein